MMLFWQRNFLRVGALAAAAGAWWDDALAGCVFADGRLGHRLRKRLERLAGSIGASLPLACQDGAATKAACRFFANDRASEAPIPAGHFRSTQHRFAAAGGVILVPQDMSEFTFRRERAAAVGITCRVNSGKDEAGRFRMRTVCGLLMHSSLVATTEGLPLGMPAVKFWSRRKFKGTAALKRKINPTRVPIEHEESIRRVENMRYSTQLRGEPERCVHVGDRESDIDELFCTAQELGTRFLARSCVDRLAGDGDRTIVAEMDKVPIQGVRQVEVRDGKGRLGTATVERRYRPVRGLPPIGRQKRHPAPDLTAVHARECREPADRPAIGWKRIASLPVASREAATLKLRWYAMRWKIEVYRKILGSGCRAAEARPRTAERLVKLIAVFCILSWRLF